MYEAWKVPSLRFSMYSSLNAHSKKSGESRRCHPAERGKKLCVAMPPPAKVEPCCGLRSGRYRNYINLGDRHEEEDISLRTERTVAYNHQLGRRQGKGRGSS